MGIKAIKVTGLNKLILKIMYNLTFSREKKSSLEQTGKCYNLGKEKNTIAEAGNTGGGKVYMEKS